MGRQPIATRSEHGVELVLDSEKSKLGTTASANPPKLVKTLRAGEGFLSQNSKWLHFGLGDAEKVQNVIVHWPDGTIEELGPLASDMRYRIEQGAGAALALQPTARNLALRQEDQQVPESSAKGNVTSGLAPCHAPATLSEPDR